MKTIKTYEDFCNEEINWRKAAAGAAIGAGLAFGSTTFDNPVGDQVKKLVGGIEATVSPSKSELYEKTDAFVQSLSTEIQSYGMCGLKYLETTSDGLYQITPNGRLINVKIKKYASGEEYESLRSDLETHYSGDTRVNKVYICGAGTIMIDCRN